MDRKVLHDLGNLLLMCVTLWAYISFSQFLIIWYGNLPEEITWYLPRIRGPWKPVGIALIVFHFAVPFAILLSRQSKRQPAIMAGLAAALLVMHLADLLWLLVPSFQPASPLLWVLVPAAMVGVNGIGAGLTLAAMRRRGELLPQATLMGATHGH
jgi:hypothetical protein